MFLSAPPWSKETAQSGDAVSERMAVGVASGAMMFNDSLTS